MSKNSIRTRGRVASAASRALQNTKVGRKVRSIAGEALVNAKRNSK